MPGVTCNARPSRLAVRMLPGTSSGLATPPLVSILLPTFGRAALLRGALASILPQVEQGGPAVELVVSDNASQDDTQSVLGALEGRASVRCFRNPVNLGVIANFRKLTVEHARGEYAWIVGDDDLLTRGSVDRLLDALRRPGPAADLVALNYQIAPEDSRPPEQGATGGVARLPGRVERTKARPGPCALEDLFDGEGQAFTPVYSLAVRRVFWESHFRRHTETAPFASLETTFPHGVMVAEAMVGRPVHYVAEPATMVFDRPLEEYHWFREAPIVTTVRYLDLLRRFERNGVSRGRLAPYYDIVRDNSLWFMPGLRAQRRYLTFLAVAASGALRCRGGRRVIASSAAREMLKAVLPQAAVKRLTAFHRRLSRRPIAPPM